MNISTVAENLRNTIAGKEMHLSRLQECIRGLDALGDHGASWSRATVTVEFLAINIDELKRILADVESCVAKDVEQSWRDNPDRMGGQFTQDEINRGNEWR